MPDRRRIVVGSRDEIPPGERKMVEVDGKSIGVFNVHGRMTAALDVCPHELAPICRGRVTGTTLPSPPGEYRWGRDGEILACPWHGWEFDLMTGEALVEDRRRLRVYEVGVEGDEVVLWV